MKESSNRRAVFVGVFVLLGLIFVFAGVLMVGNLHETFKRKMQIVSLFDDVNGLQKGNNIWFSGVKIGTISNLHFYGKSQVAVSLNIEKKLQQYIRKDATVKISTDGLIGNKILVIAGGSSAFEPVEEGDTLMVQKSVSSEEMIDMLQQNNKNVLAITSDFKSISKKLRAGEGSLGKLLNDNTLYNNINTATVSLKQASEKARVLVGSLNDYSAGLNKKGTLANELANDTLVFASIKGSVLQLQHIADTAALFIHELKVAGKNPKSSIGVLLYDEEAGSYVKESLKTLEQSSKKLDEDLEAVQHNFLLRGYFKKKAKAALKETPKK